FAGVGQHAQDAAALVRGSGDVQRGGGGGAGGDANEDAFLARQSQRRVARGGVVDLEDVVGHLATEHGGNEVRRPALDLVRVPFLTLQQGGNLGFCGGDLHFRPGQLQHLADAGQGAAGAPATDEVVEAAPGEVGEDFGRRGV